MIVLYAPSENELKTSKATLEERLERRPNGAQAAGQLFIMMCSIILVGLMADVYGIGEQEIRDYRHMGKSRIYSPACQAGCQTCRAFIYMQSEQHIPPTCSTCSVFGKYTL
jgi:hypothetical protein